MHTAQSRATLPLTDRIPVTLLVLLAYGTLAILTGMFDQDGRFPERLNTYGALNGNGMFDGEYWRLISHAFLHGGLLHLLFNGYALFIFGPALETHMGSLRFALLYVLTAIAGGATALLWGDHLVNLVGGSGALFGMMGYFLALQARSGRSPFDFLRSPSGRQMLILIVVNLAIGWMIPVISNSAHMGGLVTGLVLGVMFMDTGRVAPDRVFRITQAGWAVLYLLVVAYACFPVGNRHLIIQQWQRAEDPAVRRSYAEVLAADSAALAEAVAYYEKPEILMRAIQMEAAGVQLPPPMQGPEVPEEPRRPR